MTKAIVPILVSVAALIISLLVYKDEHSAVVASSNTTTRAYASQVSFWLQSTPSGDQPELIVQNHSTSPINNVSADVVMGYFQTGSLSQSTRELLRISDKKIFILKMDAIPACSVITSNALQYFDRVRAAFVANNGLSTPVGVGAKPVGFVITSTIASLTFMDPNGRTWTRRSDGELSPALLSFNASQGQIVSLSFVTNVKPTDGCS